MSGGRETAVLEGGGIGRRIGSATTTAVAVFQNLGLLVVSSFLFALSFPSFLNEWGFPPLAYVALIPVFIVTARAGVLEAILYGPFYALVSYGLFNYWLANFHPLALFIVPSIYAAYFLVLFPVLKFASAVGGRWGYLLQLAVWLAYEYLRTKGFLGYPYGIMGYSQYSVPLLVRFASLTGVWGVSLLVVFPSSLLGTLLADGFASLRARLRTYRFDLAAYAAFVVVVVVYGLASVVDYTESPRLKMALVQQNVDPKIGGYRAYRRSLDILVRQSRDAVANHPDLDMVVWSETSFIPAVDYHTRYRQNQENFELVRELIDFLETQSIPYVFGNGDGQLVTDDEGNLVRKDYNAVLLFEGGELQETYRKLHLVPFTEHFPYERQVPWLHDLLLENDTSFWRKGEEYTVFEAAGVKFSTPICFEDTFGYLSRGFVRRGAELIVNLTNDSWSESVAAAMQHMAMAVFRASENRRTVVRSTNGGITTIIDPNGVILDVYPAFVEGYMIGDAPIFTDSQTLYTRFGDWLGVASVVLALGGFIGFGALRLAARRRSKPDRRDGRD